MALIDCKECGNRISSLAVGCPQCGCPSSYFDFDKIEGEERNRADRVFGDFIFRSYENSRNFLTACEGLLNVWVNNDTRENFEELRDQFSFSLARLIMLARGMDERFMDDFEYGLKMRREEREKEFEKKDNLEFLKRVKELIQEFPEAADLFNLSKNNNDESTEV